MGEKILYSSYVSLMNSLSWPHMKAGANSNSSGQWWSSLFDPWLDKWADCLSEFYDWTSLIWESKNRTSPWICLEDFCFERFTQILQLWCSTSNVVNPESPACLQILTWFVRSSQILDLGNICGAKMIVTKLESPPRKFIYLSAWVKETGLDLR